MLPSLIAWSSSFQHDLAMLREDLLGSAAHVTMLAQTGLVAEQDAKVLRDTLLTMLREADDGHLALPANEEDVHMAVESELHRRLGPVAGRLHTARSRNDQVAVDLRLWVRGAAKQALDALVVLIRQLQVRAPLEADVILPAYTHRQRAQPITGSYQIAAWAHALLRAGDVLAFALNSADALPLGSGACSGSSLPIDRKITQALLGFSRITDNALDTVGDRDFALDFTWAAARVLITLSRLATDIIDFSTSEFGFVVLDGNISAGSSMMPQKKNPDLFELVRGQSARAVGDVVAMLTLVKGLPGGYDRDLQEDRGPILGAAPRVIQALQILTEAMPHVHFDRSRCAASVADGSTQATDLAETLVCRGVPFREAYKAVGALVRYSVDNGVPIRGVSAEIAATFHPLLDANALTALDPVRAASAKESIGGTGPKAVTEQINALQRGADRLSLLTAAIPSIIDIAGRIEQAPFRRS